MSRERERFEEEIGKKIKRESDALSHMGSSIRRSHDLLGGAPMAASQSLQLNTITPCAACKLLRRRCAQECPFSPYFSPLEPHKFASVHKVFGASNVSKMLMEVPEKQRADAANSLVYEANVRLRDPVYGCMGAISSLQQQIQSLQAQLNAVKAEIFKYKYYRPHEETNIIINDMVPSTTLISSGAVSIAAPPPPPPPPPPLPPPLLRRATSSSSNSMYSPPSTSTDFSTISNENVSYFG